MGFGPVKPTGDLEKAMVIEWWEGKLTWSEFRTEWGKKMKTSSEEAFSRAFKRLGSC